MLEKCLAGIDGFDSKTSIDRIGLVESYMVREDVSYRIGDH